MAAARVACGRGHGGRAKGAPFSGRRCDAGAAPVRITGGPTLADAPGAPFASRRLPAAGAATASHVPHDSSRATHVAAGHAAGLRLAGEARHSQELDCGLVRQHLAVTRLQDQTGTYWDQSRKIITITPLENREQSDISSVHNILMY